MPPVESSVSLDTTRIAVPDPFGKIFVPNEGPLDAQIAFVAEAPGADEEREGRLLIGASGNKWETCLGRNGIPRSSVFAANLFNHRPDGNKFEKLLGHPELYKSINALYDYFRAHKPTVLCTMGNWPTYFFTGKRGKKPGTGILNWRGSILNSNVAGLEDVKVIPTVHPAAILRSSVLYPIFDMDVKRVIQDSTFPELRLPKRTFVIAPKHDQLAAYTEQLLKAERLAVDIENVKNSSHIMCVGFAGSPEFGVCIEYDEKDSTTRDCLWRLLSSNIPKIFHFGTHDTELLRVNGYEVNNYFWDTIIAQHVMWPELPRSLAYLTSIYTREPYYKDEAKEEDSDTKSWSAKMDRAKLYAYNCKDITVTYEVFLRQQEEMNEGSKNWRKFFDFEMRSLPAVHSIMQSGQLVDPERHKFLKIAVEMKWVEMQVGLNQLCGGAKINPRSHTQVKTLLYDVLKLPKHYKKGVGGESKLTSEENALVALIAFCKDRVNSTSRANVVAEWKRKLLICKLIILIRGMGKMWSSYLNVRISDDGRERSRYKVPGAETGRYSAEKYHDGTGVNAQTFPRQGVELTEEEVEKVKELMRKDAGVPADLVTDEEEPEVEEEVA